MTLSLRGIPLCKLPWYLLGKPGETGMGMWFLHDN